MSNVLVRCPECGTYVEGKVGLFTHSLNCPNCGRKINPKKDSSIIVTCPECGQDVMFETTNPGDQTCPVCKASLSMYSVKDIEVECPYCHTHEMVKNNEGLHTCPICGKAFDVQKAKARKESKADTASLITVPSDNNNVIWVHPELSFPYASQLVVPEGYTALILRNGRCTAPSMPGNYLLSDSLKTVEEQLKDAVFDEDQQISVQIFFIKNTIDARFKWSGSSIKVRDERGIDIGELFIAGEGQLGIIDARKFVAFAGYENASVNDLIDPGEPVRREVANICFNTAYKLLKSKVDGGLSYQELAMNKPLFEDDIRAAVNENLSSELGLKVIAFSLEEIRFEESRASKLRKDISAYIEKPFDWTSDTVRLRNNSSKYADVQFGGSIKLRIAESNAFLDRSEVQNWANNGVIPSDVEKYFSDLAATAANDVLSSYVQQVISSTGTDVRDLSGLYTQIKGTVHKMVQQFFDGYGLLVELFTFAEKNRIESATLIKETEAEAYRTERIIDYDTHKIDNEIEVKSFESDVDKDTRIDDLLVAKESHITKNDDVRTDNIIQKLRQKQAVNEAVDLIDRTEQLKHEKWGDEDAQREHQKIMTGYNYSGEEETALHYNNLQIIQNQAEELRAKWETQSRLDYDRLLQTLRMNETRDDAGDRRILKEKDLAYRVNQGDAENERAVTSILRKIAESDLELQEKIDEYSRILNNKLEDDRLNHFITEENAKIRVAYDGSHLKNLLTEEENQIYERARQMEAERIEKSRDAEFLRSLKQQELDVMHQMEKLKMQHDTEMHENETAVELRNKQLEIDKLQMMLDYYSKLDDNEVRRLGIREVNDTARSNAENQFKIMHESKEREEEERREKDKLDREERYSQRADQLLTQMLSIQEAMKKLGFENEKVSIQENAGVSKAYAEAVAGNRRDMDRLIKELKEIANAFNKNISKTSPHTVIPPSTPPEVDPSGIRRCPHCKQELPPTALTLCPYCWNTLT